MGALGGVNVTASVSYYPASSAASGGTITLTGGKGTIKLAPWDQFGTGTFFRLHLFSFHVAIRHRPLPWQVGDWDRRDHIDSHRQVATTGFKAWVPQVELVPSRSS